MLIVSYFEIKFIKNNLSVKESVCKLCKHFTLLLFVIILSYKPLVKFSTLTTSVELCVRYNFFLYSNKLHKMWEKVELLLEVVERVVSHARRTPVCTLAYIYIMCGKHRADNHNSGACVSAMYILHVLSCSFTRSHVSWPFNTLHGVKQL